MVIVSCGMVDLRRVSIPVKDCLRRLYRLRLPRATLTAAGKFVTRVGDGTATGTGAGVAVQVGGVVLPTGGHTVTSVVA